MRYTGYMKKATPFPKDFLWGASTASHQVEGGTVNQWSVWELENASRLAKSARRRLGELPAWDDVKNQASDPSNYVSGDGVRHYDRYEEDFGYLEQLNLNAFRFGIEWARLEPAAGEYDEAAIRHYHAYIDALLERGITPVLNLWHWTVPVWFSDAGGFTDKANLHHFKRFTEKVVEEYGEKVPYIITLNEPNVYSSFSYLTGEWPPARKEPRTAFRVYRNLVKAHKQAYAVIKMRNPDIQVGVAAQLANIQAERPHNVFDSIFTKVMRYGWNWWFLNRIKRQQDFVGINYYFTDYYKALSWQRKTDKPRDAHEAKIENKISFVQRENPSQPLNDLGWYMEPEGLYPLLLRAWRHYRKPIIVTENGLADATDARRQWWLEQTMVAMERALGKGVDIRGYMHWSLLDNFEWAYGWWPRFGLVEVDRGQGMKRTVRPSARWWATQVAAARGIEPAPAKPIEPEPEPKPEPVATPPPAPVRPQPQHVSARYKIKRSRHVR